MLIQQPRQDETVLLILFFSLFHTYTSMDIVPELKNSILNFGFGINFKFEGI